MDNIDFRNAYSYYIRNFSNFEGRINRRVFWLVTIWNVLLLFVFIMIGFLMNDMKGDTMPIVMGCFFELLTFVPNFSLVTRRYHDIGLSGGWFLLTNFLPFILLNLHMIIFRIIGFALVITAIYLACKKSKIKNNKYRIE
ncbi:hypothetical protein WR164_02410 [Philodulcilactobacillus myokoensis]|uniref:DUF805 domain-containing protein n=1 Tax=Philodulcilactobacillus myokoensis TaxID=2929573 RepID=A0A9W6AZ91_9LACO|nr:DUF805 domain-containing protein [Philodulcilactobacillus myokoensis]GLB46262.1 hypothetical protein WR164_02410 [Philodulcilactobacillus myokoensis]